MLGVSSFHPSAVPTFHYGAFWLSLGPLQGSVWRAICPVPDGAPVMSFVACPIAWPSVKESRVLLTPRLRREAVGSGGTFQANVLHPRIFPGWHSPRSLIRSGHM